MRIKEAIRNNYIRYMADAGLVFCPETEKQFGIIEFINISDPFDMPISFDSWQQVNDFLNVHMAWWDVTA